MASAAALGARSQFAAGFQQRFQSKPRGKTASLRLRTVPITSALVLVPTGDGSTKHLDEAVDLPGEIALQDGVFEVGREEPADVVIPVPTVSGRHALLRIKGRKISVTDLGSTNGTYLDEEELPPNRAADIYVGSKVVFGDSSLAMFELVDRPDDVGDVASDTAPQNVVSA
ncbi:hypothetical protein CVIRNUC_005740 [Coccomyxa viridis]|uniref:FHA domain-containing protein n=1 Tax=Coccomyxa viridis TaxID=1274662 RepID=A0AAV1I7P4_9CHLO|nr:hypothetical protein CVIRNUC_005740 [Coccomyxa viridis]